MNVPEQSTKDINIINYIYDEEFINLINNLSSAIKDYFKNFKQVTSTLKAQTESINDQALCAKSDINDVLLYLTQTRSKVSPSASEKFIREKGGAIAERISKVNEIKNNLTVLIKSSEVSFLAFYDNAKEIFKKMKTTRSQKIDEINAKITFEKYIEKQQDKAEGGGVKASQQSLDSSQSSVKKYSTCNTVGNTINVKNVNLLSQSSEDCGKKNESLISEINAMKFKYKELFKENQTLKNIIATVKANTTISIDNKESQSLQSSTNSNHRHNKSVISTIKDSLSGMNSTKSRSLPKNNCYMPCNTTENEERNKKGPLISSITTKKKPSQMISKHVMAKRTFSIENNKQSHQRNDSLGDASMKKTVVPIRAEKNVNAVVLSYSNSMNNTIGINTTNSNSLNNSFSTQTSLAHLVLGFISQMKSLQESISSHHENVKEMKKDFELKKKELIKLSESIIGVGQGTGKSSTITAINSLNTTPRSLSKKTQHPQPTPQPLPPHQPHIEALSKVEGELSQVRLLNQELEKKVKNEKSISALYEEKLNEEKTRNKELNDSLAKAQEELLESNQQANAFKASVESLEKSNKDFMQLVSEQKANLTRIEANCSNYKQSNEQMQKDIGEHMKKIAAMAEDNKRTVEECAANKNEIDKFKVLISECNQNIITISNTNESIISEKDLIIKKHSETIGEKIKEVNTLSSELKTAKEAIEKLQKQLDDEPHETKDKEKNKDKEDNSTELIEELNQKISKYEREALSAKRENRELMNKISQIKNDYLSFGEEKQLIEKRLIEINTEANINLLAIQSKLAKHQQKPSDSSLNTADDPNLNCTKVNQLNQQVRKANKALEDKINDFISNEALLQQLQAFKKELAKTQEENEKMKQIISLYQGKESASNRNNPNKTLSNINEQNSNFIDDDLYNVSGIFLEEKKEETRTDKANEQ